MINEELNAFQVYRVNQQSDQKSIYGSIYDSDIEKGFKILPLYFGSLIKILRNLRKPINQSN